VIRLLANMNGDVSGTVNRLIGLFQFQDVSFQRLQAVATRLQDLNATLTVEIPENRTGDRIGPPSSNDPLTGMLHLPRAPVTATVDAGAIEESVVLF